MVVVEEADEAGYCEGVNSLYGGWVRGTVDVELGVLGVEGVGYCVCASLTVLYQTK